MTTVSLLAPVPLEHLIDGVETCETAGKVAFGSRAWEVFLLLDNERNGLPVDVFIYASGDPSTERVEASWYGRYIGHVRGINGSHPEGMTFRPKSTLKYPTDNKGHWAVFWEVDQLRELTPNKRIATGLFFSHPNAKAYKKNFIPQRPIIVIAPPSLQFPI